MAYLAFAATAAVAADVAPEAYDWSGLYVGLNGGYAVAGHEQVGIAGVNSGDLNLTGLFGGAQLGYNMQMENIVLGVEADAQLANIHDWDPSAADDLDWFGTARLRAGYAMDRTLVYATGGVALGGGTYKELVNGVTDKYTHAGWAAGAGLEQALTDNLTVKAEYIYANFGRWRVGQTIATPDFHAVRLGVNYKF